MLTLTLTATAKYNGKNVYCGIAEVTREYAGLSTTYLYGVRVIWYSGECCSAVRGWAVDLCDVAGWWEPASPVAFKTLKEARESAKTFAASRV